MRRRFVRHERCSGCGADIGITRADLEHASARCGACGERLAVKLLGVGQGPHRGADHVALAVVGPGPPTARVEETLGERPSLTVRQERGPARRRHVRNALLTIALCAAVAPVGLASWGLMIASLPLPLALLFFSLGALVHRERLTIVDGVLEHRPRFFAPVTRVRLAEITEVRALEDGSVALTALDGQRSILLDPVLEHRPETTEWVRRWILEHRPARRGS